MERNNLIALIEAYEKAKKNWLEAETTPTTDNQDTYRVYLEAEFNLQSLQPDVVVWYNGKGYTRYPDYGVVVFTSMVNLDPVGKEV